ncbi:MAG: hypothetical protein FWD73_07020 [Polyangiaceae bacterium]|nr:hypothetical protein [Polyangiaceae bacterium]
MSEQLSLGGARSNLFVIPDGAPARNCTSCGAIIYWVRTKADRAMPVDHDGTSHFATCPNAAKHRRKR